MVLIFINQLGNGEKIIPERKGEELLINIENTAEDELHN